MAAADDRQATWTSEIDDLIRGACGGFLFGIPLIYTMEVWWIGSAVSPSRILASLAITFVAVFLLNRTAGFRKTRDVRTIDALIDSVEALAVGIVCTACVLVLLREVTFTASLGGVLGKIVFESAPFTTGVALANQFLSGSDDQPDDDSSGDSKPNATLSDIGSTIIGAAIIGFSIAPTDEIPMLATAVTGPWLLGVIVASLMISYAIVFEADFANQTRRQQQRGIFQGPLSETIASYLASLSVAVFMLWFFERLSFDDPWSLWLSHTLLLGLPATIGGAAGRLAI